jgi:hypothetical protein
MVRPRALQISGTVIFCVDYKETDVLAAHYARRAREDKFGELAEIAGVEKTLLNFEEELLFFELMAQLLFGVSEILIALSDREL